ncbi:sugar nucleotide-binding protein [Butyrivibrio sp. MC2013]|uniref:sugar nucleotide-binding protein n=1 Tax=Butyrivibrio sp. MC2013 TaxID=1280686 RepID=UPI0004165E97|nr:sugar nucleotide-binding protein [Butyrivibrio sp. MC2013]
MILLTGASGFVGHKIAELPGVIACPSLRGKSEEDIRRIVEESGADVIIHTAAMSDIGTCEAHPDESYYANVQIPVYLAKAAGKRKLVCFSSDQVYSGMDEPGPYKEDEVKAANLYAREKIEMEERVLDISPDAVMLRAEWMYDYYEARSNYFMLLLNSKGPLYFSSKDYRGVTYLKEVASNILKTTLLPGGAYNYGSETDRSFYDITKDYLLKLGKDTELIDSEPSHNLWMDCSKAASYDIFFSGVENGLMKCARDYGVI